MSLRFLAFSDIHFHEYSLGANAKRYRPYSYEGDVWSQRLLDCVDMFLAVFQYATENNIKLVLFGGDLIHSKKHISKAVMAQVMVCMAEVAERSGLTFIGIPGNHDYADKNGMIHSLVSYHDQAYFIDNYSLFPDVSFMHDEQLVNVHCVAYNEDKEDLVDRINRRSPISYDYNILLCHAGIQGAKVGSDYILTKDNDLDISKINYKDFDCCLFGHYHEHQQVFPNGWIIGATHQMTFSDAGGKRGFCDVTINDDKTVTMQHIETLGYIPRFHILNEKSDLSKTVIHPQDFVRFEVDHLSEDKSDEIKGYLMSSMGDQLPTNLEIVLAKQPLPESVSLSTNNLSTDSLLEEWINIKLKDDALDKTRLLALGKEILSQARGQIEQ